MKSRKELTCLDPLRENVLFRYYQPHITVISGRFSCCCKKERKSAVMIISCSIVYILQGTSRQRRGSWVGLNFTDPRKRKALGGRYLCPRWFCSSFNFFSSLRFSFCFSCSIFICSSIILSRSSAYGGKKVRNALSWNKDCFSSDSFRK